AFGIEAMNFADVGISMEKMVVVKVDFIEISKGDMKNLGIKWADSMNIGATAGAGGGFGATDEGDFGGGDSGSGSGGFLSNLFGGGSDDSGSGGSNEGSFKGTYGLSANYGATINMIKSNSRGRVLAQPRLICRSGEKANFVAGGEVAIPLITADTSTVEYKQYGMILNISPIVDNKNNISTKIEVENSQISGFIRGRPNFNTNRVNTSINVKNGQTIVLSGMVNNADAKAVDKVPGVGSLPILGELFKSRSFRNAESELVILVTPEVMAPDDTANTEMVDGIKTKYNDEEEKMKFKLMD
ncbi:MAG: type II and III secretion system protein, partial [Deltaproteobacteria bacterium]|nr:type II and III secretion system protein [Deltaproteobacteria bacterium]